MTRSLAAIGLMLVPLFSAAAEAGYSIVEFKAEDAQVYSREFKKVEIFARVQLDSRQQPPQLNLVQVSEQGERLRFLGILLFNPKKNRWTRKVELLEREAGKLYFEIVPEGELEPFQKKPRSRAEIEVLKRPSLLEIIDNVIHKFKKPEAANESPQRSAAGSAVSAHDCAPVFPAESAEWKFVPIPGLADSARGVSGQLMRDGKSYGSFAALSAKIPRPQGQVVAALWDPANLKDLKKTTVQLLSDSPGLKQVRVEVRPLPLITIIWNESWKQSTEESGVTRIEYRKTDGDSRLRRFCGWMTVQAQGEGSSLVRLYEESDSLGRGAESVLDGHVGTVRMLLNRLLNR